MYMFKLLIFTAFFYGVQCKNNVKKLTESMGQEIIEIGLLKGLPEGLEEEPSAEFSDEEQTTTTLAAATKKDTKRTTTKPPSVQPEHLVNQLSQEEDESRIEKELAEIYKDTDYKSETTETVEEVSQTTMETTEAADQQALRNRHRVNFKFQPDTTNKAEIEKFRTSIDEINCDQRVTQRLSSNINKGYKFGMDYIIIGLAISLLCF